MMGKDRQRQIFEYVQKNKSATVQELSKLINVSISTIRRDLDEIHNQGLLRRTHGGAILDDIFEAPIAQRADREEAYKKEIGKAAGNLIKDGETIIITNGTTTESIIPHLTAKRDLMVITNSVRIAYILNRYPQIDVVVLGGWLRHSEYSLLGHLTTQSLLEFRADKLFHGIYAVSAEDGLLGTYPPEVQTDRALFGAAKEVIIVADHTKFENKGNVKLASIEDVHVLITDEKAPSEQVELLREKNINVIQVKLSS